MYKIMDQVVAAGVLAGLLFVCLEVLTGCVKHIETSGGTKIDFVTGLDVGASLNGVDTVQNERGIKPKGEQ